MKLNIHIEVDVNDDSINLQKIVEDSVKRVLANTEQLDALILHSLDKEYFGEFINDNLSDIVDKNDLQEAVEPYITEVIQDKAIEEALLAYIIEQIEDGHIDINTHHVQEFATWKIKEALYK